MFCPNCGNQVADNARFCPSCGSAINRDAAPEPPSPVVPEGGGRSFSRPPVYANSRMLKTDRSLAMYIILTIVTCGIYGFWFIHSIADDLNVACEGDGENTPGLAAYILLSIVTCGIYNIWWIYKVGNRIAVNAPRYNLRFQENGTTLLMWYIVGILLCGIGSFVAIYMLIRNMNQLASAYNSQVLGR